MIMTQQDIVNPFSAGIHDDVRKNIQRSFTILCADISVRSDWENREWFSKKP